ncbi:MAG TPA: ATP-binding protein [Phototrophicaceae bacterium]|jgi:signal transduction histidine kinase|nr:ATP-binding protein [Phototrophicaceae bacterium]
MTDVSEVNSLEQAQTQLKELIEAARKGLIIPVRLPGQLEAIIELLNQTKEEHETAQKVAAAKAKAAAVPGDAAQVMHDNAEFFKTAIHELRTPMTSIRGYSDMLNNPGMAGAMNEMQSQLLQVVRTNAKRMEGLLTDMSYVNKIRANILLINPKMDAFKNIAMMVEKKANPLAEELKRQLEFNIPSGLPLLNTDGEMLSYAMLKLIENALRYSAEGEGKVTISAEGEESTLHITISDNGIGMDETELKKLGTLFFRADDDAVRAFKGSGLGVPIAYGILENLDSKISVTSEKGKGTTFKISLKGIV